MRMEAGLDTGPIVGRPKKVPIGPDMTAGELHDVLANLGADLMARELDKFERDTLKAKRQSEEGASYAAKIDRAKTRIDWHQPWQHVHNHIRGLSPFPGAWFELVLEGQPVRIKVLRSTQGQGEGEPGTVLDNRFTIACREGAVRVVELQRAGKQPMAAEEFLRGRPLVAGTRLD